MKNLRNKIHYDELYQLYIVENKTRKELAKYFEVSEALLKERIAELNIRKPISLRVKNTEKICLEKYGTTNAGGIPETLKKIKHTCKEKYGDDIYFKTKDYKEKMDKYLNDNEIINVFQLDEVKNKIKQTNLNRYGVEHNMQNKNIWKKAFETKKKHNLFKKSKTEDYIYELLKVIYPFTKRQYNTEKYPFACDFYIPEVDTWIEYQGYWTHGWILNKPLGPFDENNEIHRETLRKWKQKAKEGYKSYDVAICVWTVSDPLKRETAKKNNLNWLEFWTLEEFMKWYEKQQ